MLTAIKNSKIDITSEKSTRELAEKLTSYLKGGEYIFLFGEMGVGKTTFVKYFINKFQTDEQLKHTEVTSPTFNLLNEYETNNFIIKHYDLFRIKNILETKDLDIFENNKKVITLVEWPQLLKNNNKAKSIDLLFTYENEIKNRSVEIKGLNLF
ncbi:tRNA (adenosine(37)-N6)-threonylcarbamoyltransferase complex ATPase subunit type 1 TsaE [Pelagibacterales bacterium SAG-MED43]|nr:tRNA (adenosine(37)-N6)-threonylcarbamoyltransferase complex ATPase subunit type 1 TsaE [Pelagibacterales bacterium SAG-MED44]MBD1137907.1 tRNA (adenosine(37)-N6)-threonylcarbamoyltransferase complex ATPase subunit type 1 TsaE [Pelagibacterales bacterium SAG-MED43]